MAIIPARAGSKGLPGKHLRVLAGKPLILWTLEAAQGASQVDRVLVSSDDPAILELAAGAGAETVLRPVELARDQVPSEPVVAHALAACGGADPELTVLLQATSPLRDAADVDCAIGLLVSRRADAVISVFEPRHLPFKCFVQDARGYLAGLFDDETPFRPRQSLPRALMPNGAIYGVRTAHFQTQGRFFGPRTVPYVMPVGRSVDIDVAADLEEAERILRSAAAGR